MFVPVTGQFPNTTCVTNQSGEDIRYSAVPTERIRCQCRKVVPALDDLRRERPPAVYGHLINVPTHINVKLPGIGGHLPNADADSHLLVVHTCYNGQCKQRPVFGGHFNPKSLAARTLSCDRQFAHISMLPYGDRKQCFISRINACVMSVMKHEIVAIWLNSFYDITS